MHEAHRWNLSVFLCHQGWAHHKLSRTVYDVMNRSGRCSDKLALFLMTKQSKHALITAKCYHQHEAEETLLSVQDKADKAHNKLQI